MVFEIYLVAERKSIATMSVLVKVKDIVKAIDFQMKEYGTYLKSNRRNYHGLDEDPKLGRRTS
ncbi:hypothetical protein BIV60_05770 [Bacillus sp. MUM 116]|nr:hypothetical protein BIV60_05770 [Bacillus sp. MUM 116]